MVHLDDPPAILIHMASGETARLYHRLSSSSHMPEDVRPDPNMPPPNADERVVQDFVSCEPERLPPAWKAYRSGLPVTELPRDWPPTELTATAVLGGAMGAPDRR